MSQDTDQPQQQEQGAQPQDQQQQQKEPEQQQQQQPADKNVDKKEIADEEREKMLNAENTKHTGAAPGSDLETEEQKPKRKMPIGGIKLPGFCRSKSKEPCKDDDTKPIENNDGGGGGEAKDAEEKGAAAAAKEAAGGVAGRTGRLFQAIRVPLTNVFSRKKKEADSELGTTGASAGLASAETLDGVAEQEKNNAAIGDDGMETVRLDIEAGDSPPLKPNYILNFLNFTRRNQFPVAAVLVVVLIFFGILFFALLGPRNGSKLPVIDGRIITRTTCGQVQGKAEESAYVFRGIPYARAPKNELRWKRPQKLDSLDYCWDGLRSANTSSEMCWQRLEPGKSMKFSGSEDCLYLDVFTPNTEVGKPVAVVVMIGADTLSGPSPGIMQPSGQLAHDFEMVFVRPNFRLDVFGFLAADPLQRDTHPPISGNYGLYDIIAVLEWVKMNIVDFGGNPDQVTVWGHRAGGTLVTALLGARQAKGLFSKAWISSASANFPTQDLREYENLNAPFLEKIGCKTAACLRNKKAEDIMDAVPSSWYSINDGLPSLEELTKGRASSHRWLVKDHDGVQQHIGDILKQENLPFKLMFGTTAQSGSLLPLKYNTSDEDPRKIDDAVKNSIFFNTTDYNNKIFKKYNKTLKALHTMISDVRVVCPLMSYSTVMNKNIPFYVTNFSRTDNIADADSDAAAIIGFYAKNTVEQRRHFTAIQQLFKDFVYQGKVKDLQVDSGKRVLIVDQDVHIEANYDNCVAEKGWLEKGWLEKGPEFARID